MLVRITCSACGRAFLVDAQHTGRKGRCPAPACRHAYIVPKPTTGNTVQKQKAPAPLPPLALKRTPKTLAGSRRTKNAVLSWRQYAYVGMGLALSLLVVLGVSQLGSRTTSSPGVAGAATVDARKPSAFEMQAAPFLKKYCIDCHSGDSPEGMLSLAKFTDERTLLKNRKTWERAFDLVTQGVMPPMDAAQPSADEKAALVGYLDKLLFQIDCNVVHDPGRVTIRRLNRAEYNNTIRDLVGIDFHPADDFPTDDVGYGFDNIGDVLSLPPLLMEKYLDAAESIARKAVLAIDPKNPSLAQFDSERLQYKGQGHRQEVITLASAGQVSAVHEFPVRGDYRVRIRAGQDKGGNEDAKMQLLLDGNAFKVVDVKARRSRMEDYEATFEAKAGRHEVSAAFINDFYDEKKKEDRNLHIQQIEIIGPLDVKPEDLPEFHRQLLAHRPSAEKTVEAAVRDDLRPFVKRAFRRPVRDEELTKYVKLVNGIVAQGESFEVGMQQAVMAVLVSPEFLFRIEQDKRPNDPADKHPLKEYELATRLSYFLWSSLPDDELFAAAERGDLHTDAVLTAQVQRMLKDPKSQSLIDNFVEQWLQLRILDEITPDPEKFPQFSPDLRNDMQEETKRLFAHLVKEDKDLRELLTAPYTFVNERLAKFYGLPNVKGNEFRQVSLEGTPRAGFLTHGSILTMTSNPNRTSPVKRGKYIMEVVLDTPPPPPPPNVPELEAAKVAATATFREQLAAHRENPSCASCHRVMDELGFGLENFDAIGRWREKDGDKALDVTGELPDGRHFRGPKELAEVLKERQDDFGRALTEKLLTYALGRGLEYYDQCATRKILKTVKDRGFKFSALATEIALSEPFRLRRGEDSQP